LGTNFRLCRGNRTFLATISDQILIPLQLLLVADVPQKSVRPNDRPLTLFPYDTIRHWRTLKMILIETPVFTRRLTKLMSDDEYRLMQALLVESPEAGAKIPKSGGLRKLRWGVRASASVAEFESFIIGFREDRQSFCSSYLQRTNRTISRLSSCGG
jgi:hypothetical protein